VRRSFRCFAGAVAAVVATGALAACNASPYAANVNGTTIDQTALNQEIAYGDRSPAYVDLVQAIASQVTGSTVSFVGDGTGTHNTDWSALELTNLVQARIIHQAVVAQGDEPDGADLDAARGVLEALLGVPGFTGIPVAYRDQLVQRLAEHASLEVPGSDVAVLRQAYDQRLADFYTQVCVRQIAVSVTATSGAIDYPSSFAAAQRIVGDYDAGPVGRALASQVTGGTVQCYSQADLETLATPFVTTVMTLAPGQAASPVKTSFGYNVVAVVSRSTEPFAGAVARALQAALYAFEPGMDVPLLALEQAAHVKVERSYGSWNGQATAQALPGVVPPSAPAAAPGAPGTTVPSYNPFAGTT